MSEAFSRGGYNGSIRPEKRFSPFSRAELETVLQLLPQETRYATFFHVPHGAVSAFYTLCGRARLLD
jgi:hypothetical protein